MRRTLKLGVNIDHVATLRQARLGKFPSPEYAAKVCEQAGADGITAHLREDRRHIQDADMESLARTVKRLNMEMAVTDEMVGIASRLRPANCCLVPEKRRELTTEGGLDAAGSLPRLTDAVSTLKSAGITVSIFIDPVEAQIEAVLEDIGADAVKLGMLPNAEIIEAVARQLIRFQVRNIVLDPVMISTSGHRLIDLSAVEAIRERLFPLATLITPNLPEAEYITGIKITSEEDFAKVAAAFQNQNYSGSILLKAGHLNASSLTDYLYTGKEVYSYRYDRIDTPNTHGTGCTLSSSIATFLAAGHPLPDAVDWAEKYIHKAILCGKEYEIGHGHGPVDHFYRFRRAFEG